MQSKGAKVDGKVHFLIQNGLAGEKTGSSNAKSL